MVARKSDASDDVLTSLIDWAKDLRQGATWEVLLEPWIVPIAIDALGGLAPLIVARTAEEYDVIAQEMLEHVRTADKEQVAAYAGFIAATQAWPEIEEDEDEPEPEPVRRRARR